MRRINPTVETKAETAAHAVRVFFVAKRSEENLTQIGYVIAIRVSKVPDIRDAEGDATSLVLWLVPRQHTRGNVQPIGEISDFVRATVTVRVFENLNGIAAIFDAGPLGIGPS